MPLTRLWPLKRLIRRIRFLAQRSGSKVGSDERQTFRIGGYRLRLSYEDGSSGDVDFSHEDWGGVFAPLADPTYFAQVQLDDVLGTIVWPNGADIAPETLHQLVNG